MLVCSQLNNAGASDKLLLGRVGGKQGAGAQRVAEEPSSRRGTRTRDSDTEW